MKENDDKNRIEDSKVVALFLPQFHEIPENNAWWGEGYTEWVAVKNAKKEFPWQYQPKEPLNNNYYDLSKVETLKWQAELLNKYNVDGLCFYHYYFGGKKILEKPAELLLDHVDINMPFFFCWANESWAASWSKRGYVNKWSVKHTVVNEKGNEYLLKQSYGNEDDWKEHYRYLSPFFHDKRYIKIDNKPVFIIYRAEFVISLKEMCEMWIKLAKEEGLEGIYFVSGDMSKAELDCIEATYIHAPLYGMLRSNCSTVKAKPGVYDYDEVWGEILKAKGNDEKTTIFGGFVGYDDTPRRHNDTSHVIYGQDPNKFSEYLAKLIAKNYVYKSPLIIINAWNEWGEGMYLEPDEKNKYLYLEAIEKARRDSKKYIELYRLRKEYGIDGYRFDEINKKSNFLEIENNWVQILNPDESFKMFFDQYTHSDVYIYGYGNIGHRLVEQLDNSGIEIAGIINREYDNETKYEQLKIGDRIENNSLIILALSYDIPQIKSVLSEVYNDNEISIVWINDLLREILEKQKLENRV